jgi:hypothetical protein
MANSNGATSFSYPTNVIAQVWLIDYENVGMTLQGMSFAFIQFVKHTLQCHTLEFPYNPTMHFLYIRKIEHLYVLSFLLG